MIITYETTLEEMTDEFRSDMEKIKCLIKEIENIFRKNNSSPADIFNVLLGCVWCEIQLSDGMIDNKIFLHMAAAFLDAFDKYNCPVIIKFKAPSNKLN